MPVARRVAACALLAPLAAAPCAFAGDLAPPGAPAPTMKTLDEVEPRIPIGPLTTPGDADSVFRISQPGSYYLTGNLIGQANRCGIEIASSGVSIDLMGFTLEGVPGSREGVNASVTSNAVSIVNGTIRGWGFEGVDLNLVDGSRLRGLIVEGSGSRGIFVSEEAIIIECVAIGNGGNGFLASNGALVKDCVAEGNTDSGFAIGSRSQVIGVTANDNGIHGVSIGTGSSVVDSNAYSNDADGFAGSSGVSVINCAAAFNSQDGIDVGGGSTVRGNTVYASTEDGIEVSDDSMVSDNKVGFAGNGGSGAGIYVLGSGTHVEGNSIHDSDIGIQATATSNLVIRNTLRTNTVAFDLATGNKVGPIVVAPSSGVVAGTVGAAGVGTSNPWANLVY
ncbi:MAG: right-handed parallel beta-helix repeat-containing protein [Phycisphaerales bacterium]